MASTKHGKYEEVVEMHDIQIGENGNANESMEEDREGNSFPNIPSLHEPQKELDEELIRALGDINEGTGIKIVKTPIRKNYGAFNFTIRDARTDSVLLQGEIDFRQAANISGLEGNPLFHIISLDNGHKFVTKSRTGLIGRIETNDPSFISLRTTGNLSYTVNVIGTEDIVISRLELGEILVKIHIPPPSVPVTFEAFECTIGFQDGLSEPITTAEKTLCISVAIVYLMVRNGPIQAHGEHSSGKCSVTCVGAVIASIVIILFMVFILYLTLNECRWKPYKPGCPKT